MILKLMLIDCDSWHEVTKPIQGNRVYLFDLPTEDKDGNGYNGREQEGLIESTTTRDIAPIIAGGLLIKNRRITEEKEEVTKMRRSMPVLANETCHLRQSMKISRKNLEKLQFFY